MNRRLSRLIGALTLCMALFLCEACHKDHHVEYDTSSTHTLLLYMIGDNSLSGSVSSNLNDAIAGLQTSETPLNLIVYQDGNSRNKLPQLYQLKRRSYSHKVDTIKIKSWSEEVNSADPAFVAKIAELVFNRYDTPIKGMELWGHGLSWIPSDSYQVSNEAAATRAATWYGPDFSQYGEFWELGAELKRTGIHLDYMLFDACHMSTAEVAYELRDFTDYILAAPSEIIGEGFPYRKMILALSHIKDRATLESGLEAAFEAFEEKYKNGGTFTLLKTEGLERLHQACVELSQNAQETLALWAEDPKIHEMQIQHYGRWVDKTNYRYYFYDLDHWAYVLSTKSECGGYESVHDALKDCVIRSYHSQTFLSVQIEHCCGLAMSIPQFWSLSGQKNKLDSAYRLIQWNL